MVLISRTTCCSTAAAAMPSGPPYSSQHGRVVGQAGDHDVGAARPSPHGSRRPVAPVASATAPRDAARPVPHHDRRTPHAGASPPSRRPCGRGRGPRRPPAPSRERPAAVDAELGAVHRRVLEQEHRGVDRRRASRPAARWASAPSPPRAPRSSAPRTGCPPRSPGWSAFTRIGASSADQRPDQAVDAALTVVHGGRARDTAAAWRARRNSTIEASSRESREQARGRPRCSRRASA